MDLSRDESAAIFRRAAELDRIPVAENRLSQASVEEIATMAGLSPDSVRRATLELKAGLLAVDQPTSVRIVSVQRHFNGDPSLVRQRLEAALKRQSFAVLRNHETGLVAVRAKGVISTMNRRIDPLRRQTLSRTAVTRVEGRVSEVAGLVLARLDGELPRLHRSYMLAPAAGLVAAGAFGASTLIGGFTPVDVLSVPAMLFVTGIGVNAGFGSFRLARRDAVVALEGILDRLEPD